MLCSLDDKNRDVKLELENKFKAKNYKVVSDRQNMSPDECFDLIEKSSVIVFIANNSYIRSTKLKKEEKLVEKLRKVAVFILIEEVETRLKNKINLDQLNVVSYYELKKDNQITLDLMISNLIQTSISEQSYVQVKRNEIIKTTYMNKSIQVEGKFCFFDDYENNQILILKISTGWLRIYRRSNFELIKETILEFFHRNIREHNILIIFFNRNINSYIIFSKSYIIFINADSLDEEKYINHSKFYCCPTFFHTIFCSGYAAYDVINQTIFIACHAKVSQLRINVFDCNSNILKQFTLKNEYIDRSYENNNIVSFSIVNGKVYVVLKKRILEYDLEMRLIKNIVFQNIITQFIIDPLMPKYAFISDENNIMRLCRLSRFNFCTNFSVNVSNTKNYMKHFITNNSLLCLDTSSIDVYDFNSRCSIDSLIEKRLDSYLCKQKGHFRNHLLRNSCYLACGNSVCLECIFQNYDTYRLKFYCNAETCKCNHDIKNNDLQIISFTDEEVKDIYEIQFVLADKVLLVDDKIDAFEDYFDNLENNIEIRIESIKIEIDNSHVKFIEKIDELEDVLLNETNFEKKFKFSVLGSSLNFQNIGLVDSKY